VNPLWTLYLCIFIAMTGLGIISPILPNYASNLGATGIMIGLIYSSFSLSRAILQIPIGRLSDSFSKKKIIVSGLSVYTLVSILYVFADSPEKLISIRIFHGAASAMVMPVAMAYATILTPEGKEGRYMGYMNTAMFSGFGAGPLLGGFLYEHYSIEYAFYSMSAIVSFSLALTIIILPEERSLTVRKERPRVSYREIISNRRLNGVLVYRLVNAIGRGNIMSFLSLFAVQSLGLSGTVVGLILSIGIFTNAFLQTPMGYIADRYDKNLLIILGGIIGSAGYFTIIYTGNATELLISRLIISFGGALSIPALTSIAAEEGKKLGAGSTMGVFSTSMSLGQIVGPVLSGALLDMYGMGAVYNLSGLVGLISVAAFYILSR